MAFTGIAAEREGALYMGGLRADCKGKKQQLWALTPTSICCVTPGHLLHSSEPEIFSQKWKTYDFRLGNQRESRLILITVVITLYPLRFPPMAHRWRIRLQGRSCSRRRFDPWVGKIPLEEDIAIHSSNLAWRIPWTEEPGGLQSTGWQRVGHDWSDLARHRSTAHPLNACSAARAYLYHL